MATFGRTDATGFTNPGNDTVGDILGNTFTLTEDGTVTSISGYFNSGAHDAFFRGVIYPVSGGQPDGQAPIAVTTETHILAGTGGWQTATFSAGVPLTAGDYYLGVWFGGDSAHDSSTDTSLMFDSTVGTWDWEKNGSYSSTGAAPNPFVSNGTGTGTWGVFATYTPGSGGSPQTVSVTGLDSAAAFGTESITTTVTVNVTGLNSPRAFGSITTQGGAITFLVAVSGGRFYHRRGAIYEQFELAPSGSTGDNTHAGVHVGGGQEALVFQFVAETVGASPTVTWKVQGSPDDPSLLDDASANWYDVGYVTDSSDTISQATRTRTSEGGDIAFLANPVARRFQRYRLVVTGNTNVTYRAEMFRVSSR